MYKLGLEKAEEPQIKVQTSIGSQGFPGSSDGEESAWNVGNQGSIPGLGRSPGRGNGIPFLENCLENSMDRGAWRATVLEFVKNQTWLSIHVPLNEKAPVLKKKKNA